MSDFLLRSWFPALAGGFAIALALTPLTAMLARRFDIVARPKADRWHRTIIPMLGGIAIWGGAAAMVALPALRGDTDLPIIAIVGSLMFLTGLVDDFWHLRPSTKLTAQIAVACLALYFGRHVSWTGSLTADSLLSLVWIVGLTNAFNLLDNMDGLCAGIAVITSAALAVSLAPHSPALAAYAAAIGGACAAFLIFNFKPASIFMGDSGSLFIGSTLALLTIGGEGRAQTHIVSTLAVPVLIMLLPIFDVTFVTLARLLSSRSASQGGTDHTSHRLVAMGFSEREAVLLLYGLALLGAATATIQSRTLVPETGAITALLMVGVVLFGVHLARVKVYDGEDYAALRGKPYTPLLLEITYRRRLFEIALDVGLITLAYYWSYIVRFDEQFHLNYPKFVESLPVVIACQLLSLFVAGVYRGVWRYVGLSDLGTYARAVLLGAVSTVIALVYLFRFEEYSRGVFIVNALLLGAFLTGSRLSFRVLGEASNRRRASTSIALIYGAGDGGAVLVRELRNNRHYDHRPVGFIDDDPAKAAKSILGVPVLGAFADVPRLLERWKPDVIIISTSGLDDIRYQRIRQLCYESGTALLQLDFGVRAVKTGPAAGSDEDWPN